MPVKPAGREELHAFFQFDDIIERPGFAVLLFLLQLAAMGYGFAWALEWDRPGREAIFGLVYMDAALVALAIMAASACVIFLLLSLFKILARIRRDQSRHARAAKAREILRQDYKRALRAILKASGLRPSDMLPVKTAGAPHLERLLFDEDDLETFLGPVRHQSFRAVTPYGRDIAYGPAPNQKLADHAYFEGLCTPFYLVCLFITETHYVVGEAVCNSLAGTLQSRVKRIPKQDIASSDFRTAYRTLPLPDRILDDWLVNRRFDTAESRRVTTRLQKQEHANRKSGHYRYATAAPAYGISQKIRFLEISLNDGRTLQLPTQIDQAIILNEPTGYFREFDDASSHTFATGWGDIAFKTREFSPYTSGYLDDPPEGAQVSGERALWSTGRQVTHRAFLAFPNLFVTLLTALILAAGILWLMNSLTNDTSQSQSSSDESGYRMDTPQGIVPVPPVKDQRA